MADEIITVETNRECRQLNEDGEEIIMESKYSRWVYFTPILYAAVLIFISGGVSLLVGIIAMPIVIIMLIFQVRSWRLYLTQDAIHYHEANFDCCGGRTIVIPLSDIESICDRYGIHPSINITMKRSNWMKMMNIFPNACNNKTTILCCIKSNYVIVTLSYVKNPAEFLQAVQTCMG